MRSASRLLPLVALTLLGAALRLPTLDRQSFWLDELVTVSLLDRGFGDVLREIPRTEATPFVYYVLYTFLLRQFLLDLTRSRDDPRRKRMVDAAYVGVSLLVYGTLLWKQAKAG